MYNAALRLKQALGLVYYIAGALNMERTLASSVPSGGRSRSA